MKQRSENIRKGGGPATYVPVERRKAAVAVCLLAVMAFMWIRMLIGGPEPASASAEALAAGKAAASANKPSNVIYTDLPVVSGRNDALTSDFFAAEDWGAFFGSDNRSGNDPGKKVSIISEEDERIAMIRNAAAGLKLQIIEMGTEPQAFISDRLVTVGTRFPLAAGDQEVVFEVTAITATSVSVACEDQYFEVTLPGE